MPPTTGSQRFIDLTIGYVRSAERDSSDPRMIRSSVAACATVRGNPSRNESVPYVGPVQPPLHDLDHYIVAAQRKFRLYVVRRHGTPVREEVS
ncbi:MAG TPA: hypothetical protein VIJ35_29005, partial [Bradyrhizobium sp.]